METMVSLLGLIPILIYIGIILFVIYAIAVGLRLMKEKNEYLKDIRDEMRKETSIQANK